MTELKKGQRIEVFEILEIDKDEAYSHLTGRHVACESLEENSIKGFTHVAYHTSREDDLEPRYARIALKPCEIKRIGTFIVREVKTNVDPVTII